MPTESNAVTTPNVDLNAPPTAASVDAQTPDLERTQDAIERPRNRSIEATLLTVLAVLYSLYAARVFLIIFCQDTFAGDSSDFYGPGCSTDGA